jgi:hypothetical protein
MRGFESREGQAPVSIGVDAVGLEMADPQAAAIVAPDLRHLQLRGGRHRQFGHTRHFDFDGQIGRRINPKIDPLPAFHPEHGPPQRDRDVADDQAEPLLVHLVLGQGAHQFEPPVEVSGPDVMPVQDPRQGEVLVPAHPLQLEATPIPVRKAQHRRAHAHLTGRRRELGPWPIPGWAGFRACRLWGRATRSGSTGDRAGRRSRR